MNVGLAEELGNFIFQRASVFKIALPFGKIELPVRIGENHVQGEGAVYIQVITLDALRGSNIGTPYIKNRGNA